MWLILEILELLLQSGYVNNNGKAGSVFTVRCLAVVTLKEKLV